MQKFLFVLKNLSRPALLVGLVFYILFFPFVLSKTYKSSPTNDIFGTKSADVVMDMWHIEAFEGGTSPRKSLLEKVSMAYNKSNPGVFVAIRTMTLEQYVINVKQNKPDIISFPRGIVDSGMLIDLPRLKILNEEHTSACQKQGELLCYPYMLGRYVLISKDKISPNNLCGDIAKTKKKMIYPLGISNTSHWQKVLSENNYLYNNVKQSLTQYDNYKDFIDGNIKVLLGSQRDVHRLKLREEKGKIEALEYVYLDGYTDLVQYIGVCCESNKVDRAKAFCEYLMSYDSQIKINSIGMFSAVYDIYTDGYMNEWENAVNKTTIISPF